MPTINSINIGTGTSGQVLKSNGTGVTPTFQNELILSTAVTTITSAQIKVLRATPLTLIAAQGANTIITVVNVSSKYVYAGTNAFTNGQNIILRYGNGLNAALSGNIITATSLNGTINTFGTQLGLVSQIDKAAGVLDNSLIQIANSGASEITGNAANDNTLILQIFYIVSSTLA